MNTDHRLRSIGDRNAILATLILSPVVAVALTVGLAFTFLDAPNLLLLVIVSFVAGTLSAASGEPFGDALIRTLIASPIVVSIWWFADSSHWIPQGFLSMLTSGCIGGLSFGIFRGATGR